MFDGSDDSLSVSTIDLFPVTGNRSIVETHCGHVGPSDTESISSPAAYWRVAAGSLLKASEQSGPQALGRIVRLDPKFNLGPSRSCSAR